MDFHMIVPALKDAQLLASIKAQAAPPSHFRLWWLGQSGFLIQWQGHHLLLDPYLSDSLTRKYAATDKPHVRMTERAIAPEQLDFLEVVTSSHNHTDHLDADTLLPLLSVNAEIKLVIPEANRKFVAGRLGMSPETPIGLDDGASAQVGVWQITGVASAHETLERDEAGRHKFLGYVVGFGPWRIYHSGDTVMYEGIIESVAAWRVDVALLPINGARPERRVAGNLSGVEAARLAHAIKARCVIPCHYEMFAFNTESPEAFAAEAARIGQPHKVLRCGDPWCSDRLA